MLECATTQQRGTETASQLSGDFIANALWFARAASAVSEMKFSDRRVSIIEDAYRKSAWNAATAVMVNNSRSDPQARKALAPKKAKLSNIEDNEDGNLLADYQLEDNDQMQRRFAAFTMEFER